MKVESEVFIEPGHSIEFGRASWDETARSVRNRYATAAGGFSPHSSSELPIEDVMTLAVAVLNQDCLSLPDSLAILKAAADSILRMAGSSD